ncbi:MAG: hypothetical protein KZQ90_00250 [Candidatus Thiodiazotropha sp. (ex Codakia rugifera)]|nr:hypothetical protein [Candidatus Thiodiazotropha sp. (ex Codakia rugifera)]
MRENVPYSQILDFLTNLVDNKTSGTLFVHSESNHAITIALENGRIHAIYFGARRGRKAIPLVSNISGGSYKFEASGLVGTFHDLPTTPEVLNLLRNPHTTNESRSTDSSPVTHNDVITEENKTILCQELKGLLAEHMGPIAEMIFDDVVSEVGDFCSTPKLTQDLINKLSAEIDDSTEVEQFRGKAYLALNNVLKS